MKKLALSIFIGACMMAFKIIAFPAGDEYTWRGELLFALPAFLIPFAICMAVLPTFKVEED